MSKAEESTKSAMARSPLPPLDQVAAVLDALNCGALLLDRSGRVLHANARLCEMYGLTCEELIGDNLHRLHRAEGRRPEPARGRFIAAVHRLPTYQLRCRLLARSGPSAAPDSKQPDDSQHRPRARLGDWRAETEVGEARCSLYHQARHVGVALQPHPQARIPTRHRRSVNGVLAQRRIPFPARQVPRQVCAA